MSNCLGVSDYNYLATLKAVDMTVADLTKFSNHITCDHIKEEPGLVRRFVSFKLFGHQVQIIYRITRQVTDYKIRAKGAASSGFWYQMSSLKQYRDFAEDLRDRNRQRI